MFTESMFRVRNFGNRIHSSNERERKLAETEETNVTRFQEVETMRDGVVKGHQHEYCLQMQCQEKAIEEGQTKT